MVVPAHSRRVKRLCAQVCAGAFRPQPVPTKPGENEEGRSAVAPEEDSGRKMPDGRTYRKLPDLAPGVVSLQATKEKYEFERNKRMAFTAKFGSGTARTLQYPRIADLAKTDLRFAKMLADPYVAIPDRQPLQDEVGYAVLGAGYGGLLAFARLREAGIDARDIRVFEKGGDVGGTWYWNRYPGAMCDVEAYVYMPLCEETNYVPAEKYCHQPEMMYHSQLIAEKYGLYDNALFGTAVNTLRWDEQAMRWVIGSDKNDAIKAKFVIVNFGFFSHPKLPAVPGVAEFQGHMWHTSRWDYEYTGGSSAGGLTKLADKRVGIIGTGATAIQAVPHLGRHAKQLVVFQRTPSTVNVRNNHHTTPEFAKQFMSKEGWQRERMENFRIHQEGEAGPEDVDMVADGFTELAARVKKVRQMTGLSPSQLRDMMDLQDYEHVEQIRMRMDAVVKDKPTAEALKPWFRLFCKRPCFHDDYLDTFNNPSVTLVDTNGEGIQAMTRKGVVANGQEYELDCICLATGFEVSFFIGQEGAHNSGAGLTERKVEAHGFQIFGKGGLRLGEHWAGGPRTLRSFATRGFPNMFWLNGPQGTVTGSATHALDILATHVARLLAKMKREGKAVCEPSQKAEEDYCSMIYNASTAGRGFFAACTPGYYNNEGEVDLTTKSLFAPYPDREKYNGGVSLFRFLEKQQEDDSMLDGFDSA